MEKNMIQTLHHLYFMIGLTDNQGSAFLATFAAAVYGYKEVMITTPDGQRNFPIVPDDNGAYIETMRCNGSQCNRFGMRNHDRTTHAQGISCGTRRGCHHQSISLICGEIGAIHCRADADHGRTVSLEHSNLVESKRIAFQLLSLTPHLQQSTVLNLVTPGI